MRERFELVEHLKTEVTEELARYIKDEKAYKELLQKLMVQVSLVAIAVHAKPHGAQRVYTGSQRSTSNRCSLMSRDDSIFFPLTSSNFVKRFSLSAITDLITGS